MKLVKANIEEINKPFYVLSGSSYLKNSGITNHPLYKGAIAIEKKNNLFNYTLNEIPNSSNSILVCQYIELLVFLSKSDKFIRFASIIKTNS